MSKEVVVVKFGSDLVADIDGVKEASIDEYVVGLSKLHEADHLMVVTSGAVACGRARINMAGGESGRYSLSQLAQLGSSAIFSAWESAFAKVGRMAGGLLVTHHELAMPEEGDNFHRLLDDGISTDVIPIINANDAVSFEELNRLKVAADNDDLASRLAVFIGAKKLRLFTAKGGVFNEDGQLIDFIDSQKIEDVKNITNQRNLSGGNGRGGIQSKVDAVWRFVSETGGVAEIAQPNQDMSGTKITTFKT